MRVKDVNRGGLEEFCKILFPSALKDELNLCHVKRFRGFLKISGLPAMI